MQARVGLLGWLAQNLWGEEFGEGVQGRTRVELALLLGGAYRV